MVAHGLSTKATVSVSTRLVFLLMDFFPLASQCWYYFFFYLNGGVFIRPGTVNMRELNQLFDAGCGNSLVFFECNKGPENI